MITVILVLAMLGLFLFLIETFVPMSPPFVVIIRVVVVIFSLLYILRVFGVRDIPMR
jgi:hypothetical protein